MPRADDLPSFERRRRPYTPCTHNPLGVKGCGEAGAIGSPPAFINALTDALGVEGHRRCRPRRTRLARRQRHARLNATEQGDTTMYAFDYQRPAEPRRRRQGRRQRRDARYLAGGQSLIQAMKLRLRSPSALVDLGGDRRAEGHQGRRQRRDDRRDDDARRRSPRSAEVQQAIPALAELAGGIGDPMVRNMGTHRRLDRQRRPGGVLPGRACWASARRSTPTSARSPPTTSSPACTRPRCSRAS